MNSATMRAPVRWKPVGHVQDHAGVEARLGRAQQEAQHIELRGRGHEHHGRRDQAPHDHDAGNGGLGAYAVHQHVAGHLEEEIADEEQPGSQPVHGLAELQVGQHVQLGKAHVHAVQVGRDIAGHDEGQQAPGHLAVDGGLGRRFAGQRRCRAGGFGGSGKR
jgi:hypothetical protein